MAVTNVLGYNTNVKTGEVIAARNAAVDLGQGHIAMVQSFQGQTAHQVTPVYEIGSSAVYLVMGNPQAAFKCTALVSKEGFFAPFANIAAGAACGELRSINVNLGSELECDPKIISRATAKFTGAILQSLFFSIQAGQLYITQSAEFVAGSLDVI